MRRRTLLVLIVGVLVIAMAGFAAATIHRSGRDVASTHANARSALGQKSEKAKEAKEDEADGVHGGTVARFHEGCSAPSALSGNWTHGDYVSAWARTGDAEKIQAAAHSRCGKPSHAAGRSEPPGRMKARPKPRASSSD